MSTIATLNTPSLQSTLPYTHEKTYSLKGKAISKLNQSDFHQYKDEKILDISDNQLRYLPDWLSNYSFDKIILSNNHPQLGVFLLLKYPQWLEKCVVEAKGLGFTTPPKGMCNDKFICDNDGCRHVLR